MVEEKNPTEYDWQCTCICSPPPDTPAIWVFGIFITPDGKKLINTYGGGIYIWDLKTGMLDCLFDEESPNAFSLAISPERQIIATGSLNKKVDLWNLQTYEFIGSLSCRADPIQCVAFSYDEKILASGGMNKYKSAEGKTTTIYLWDLETKELMGTLSGHYLRVNCLAFSPDNRILASGSYDKTIKIWDLETKQLIYTLAGHSSYVAHLRILPDCKTLISSGGGGIKFWDLTTGELLNTLSEDIEYVREFAISPDGNILASDAHNTIRIWNLETRKLIHVLEFQSPISITFSPDSTLLASGNAQGNINVWQIPSNLNRKEFQPEKESILDEAAKYVEAEGYFDPENIEDARSRINTSIVRRQGQASFRKTLLEAYNYQCVFTSCDAEQALEAAHIIPYLGSNTNHPTNGLLLRADIHTLFDLHLLTINPATMTVEVAPSLKNTCYGELRGNQLPSPKYEYFKPNRKAIEQHYQAFLQKHCFSP